MSYETRNVRNDINIDDLEGRSIAQDATWAKFMSMID